VHGQQAHHILGGDRGPADAAGLERTDEGIGREVAAAADLQRRAEQGLQVGQHAGAQG
jgi:hypothetical protein